MHCLYSHKLGYFYQPPIGPENPMFERAAVRTNSYSFYNFLPYRPRACVANRTHMWRELPYCPRGSMSYNSRIFWFMISCVDLKTCSVKKTRQERYEEQVLVQD